MDRRLHEWSTAYMFIRWPMILVEDSTFGERHTCSPSSETGAWRWRTSTAAEAKRGMGAASSERAQAHAGARRDRSRNPGLFRERRTIRYDQAFVCCLTDPVFLISFVRVFCDCQSTAKYAFRSGYESRTRFATLGSLYIYSILSAVKRPI